GAVQVRCAEWLPARALSPVGAPGSAAGVTASDGADSGPLPARFAAWTVNVTEAPLVNPVTVALFSDAAAVAVCPLLAVTMYPVMGVPPFLSGAVQLTVACPSPGAAVTPVGPVGGMNVLIDAEGADSALEPIEFCAFTLKT